MSKKSRNFTCRKGDRKKAPAFIFTDLTGAKLIKQFKVNKTNSVMKDFLIFILFIAVLMLALGVYCIAFGSNLEAKMIAGFPLILSGFMFFVAYACRDEFKDNLR